MKVKGFKAAAGAEHNAHTWNLFQPAPFPGSDSEERRDFEQILNASRYHNT